MPVTLSLPYESTINTHLTNSKLTYQIRTYNKHCHCQSNHYSECPMSNSITGMSNKSSAVFCMGLTTTDFSLFLFGFVEEDKHEDDRTSLESATLTDRGWPTEDGCTSHQEVVSAEIFRHDACADCMPMWSGSLPAELQRVVCPRRVHFEAAGRPPDLAARAVLDDQRSISVVSRLLCPAPGEFRGCSSQTGLLTAERHLLQWRLVPLALFDDVLLVDASE